jgi:hypothetical protein
MPTWRPPWSHEDLTVYRLFVPIAVVAGCGFDRPPVALVIDDVTPADGQGDVHPLTSIDLRFRNGGIEGPLPFTSILVTSDGEAVEGTLSGSDPVASGSGITYGALHFTPSRPLRPLTYRVVVPDPSLASDDPVATFSVRPWRWTPATHQVVSTTTRESPRVLATGIDEAALIYSNPTEGLSARTFSGTWGRTHQGLSAAAIQHRIATAVARDQAEGVATWMGISATDRVAVFVSVLSAGFWSDPRRVTEGFGAPYMSAAAGSMRSRLVSWVEYQLDGTNAVAATWRMNDNDWAPTTTLAEGADIAGLVSAMGSGGAVLAWVATEIDTDGGSHRVVWGYRGFPGSGGGPILLGGPNSAEVPDLQVAGDSDNDHSIVAWLERDGAEHRVRARRWRQNSGWSATWTVTVATSLASVRVAADPETGFVVWTDRDPGGRTWFARLGDGGSSDPMDVGPALLEPQVRIDGGGNLLLAGVTGSGDIVAVRYLAPSGWSAPELVAAAVPGARALSGWIANDGRGSLAWIQDDAGDASGALAAVSLLE